MKTPTLSTTGGNAMTAGVARVEELMAAFDILISAGAPEAGNNLSAYE
jgi:hypothetical protein